MFYNPYEALSNGRWLIGNLHAHTTASDGESSHQEVVDEYAKRGHGFLMISDHDTYASAELYDGIDTDGMILIPGTEITAGGPHLLHVGAGRLVDPDPERQRVVDSINADAGFAIFNHPNWQKRFDHCPQELLESCSGYLGIEIYNGVISRLEGSAYATDRWDMLLSSGERLWGFANDDSHRAEGDTGHGWNVAYVTDESPAGVIDTLARGRFYASTGVTITDIEVEAGHVTIEAVNAERIVAITDHGIRIAQADGASLSVDAPTRAGYLRFECWGAGESFAWTQPILFDR